MNFHSICKVLICFIILFIPVITLLVEKKIQITKKILLKIKYTDKNQIELCSVIAALIFGAIISILLLLVLLLHTVSKDYFEGTIVFIFLFIDIIFWFSGFSNKLEYLLKNIFNNTTKIIMKLIIFIVLIFIFLYVIDEKIFLDAKVNMEFLLFFTVGSYTINIFTNCLKRICFFEYLNCIFISYIISLNIVLIQLTYNASNNTDNKLNVFILLILALYSVKNELTNYLMYDKNLGGKNEN